MTELVFQTLSIEHFRCFAAKQTFQLSPGPGLWFLRGKNEVEPALSANGAGKSTVFEAFCWVIGGETSKGLRNPDLKPWVGKGTPTVELRLLKDGEPHSIRRQAVTNGLQIDGVEAGAGEAEKLLGLPLEVLLNTNLFAQGAALFLDKKPKEKFELLSAVLPLERWEDRSIRAAARVKELEALEAEMRGEATGLRSALEQTESLLIRTQGDSTEWERDKQDAAENAELNVKQIEIQLAQYQPRVDAVELAHDGAWVRLREMRVDIVTLRDAQTKAEQACHTWENEQTALKRDRDRLARELAKLEEAKVCPSCGQPVKKANLKTHKAELEAQLEEILPKIQRFIPEDLVEPFDEAQARYAQLNEKLVQAERETDELQSKLLHGKSAIERMKAELIAAKAKRDANKDERNPYADQIQALRQQKRKQEGEIEELEGDLQKAQVQIKRVGFWVKGFKDVALYLIEEVLQELEAVTNALLGEVGLAGWQVNYAIERETKSGTVQRGINLAITPPYDYLRAGGKGGGSGGAASSHPPIKWESWSGGEGQRLRLVGSLALSEVLLGHSGVSTNLEVFDEPTQHLSSAGVADLCTYLSARAKAQGKTIWLIDHQAREGAAFAGSVTVTKTEKGSIFATG